MELKANYTGQGDSGSNRQRLHICMDPAWDSLATVL